MEFFNQDEQEDGLIVSNEMFQTLFETAAESIIITNNLGEIIKINKTTEKLFGYNREELLGKRIEILIPKRFNDHHLVNRNQYFKEPKSRSMGGGNELYALKKNGKEFPVEIGLNRIKNEEKSLTMAMITDISERKQQEIRLLRIEESLKSLHKIISNEKINYGEKIRNILEFGCKQFNQPIGMISKIEGDSYHISYFFGENSSIKEGQIFELYHTFCSETITKKEPLCIKNTSRSKWHAHPCYQNLKLESYIGIALKVNGVSYGTLNFSSEEPRNIRFSLVDKEILKIITESISHIIGKDLHEKELLQLNEKLEQRVNRRNEALTESYRVFSLIAHNFPNGEINIFDKDLNYVFAEGMEMHKRGISGDLLIGTSFLKRVDTKIREEIKEKLMNVFNGENANFELSINSKIYRIYALGLSEIGNQINQIIMVSQNITNLKKAEEDSKRAFEKEQQLNELKSQFVSMASHEFRTPLTSIMNSVTLLSKYIGTDGNEEKQFDHVKRIRASMHYLTGMLNDFLSIEKLEQSKMELNSSYFSLPKYCEKIIENMSDIAKKGQNITYQHIGGKNINADKQMLKNIFYNLLSNAIKYSAKDGEISFKTFVENGVLKSIVSDKGIGIPKEDQNRLFERFFRAKNAQYIQGTGLGLNILKKQLNLVGGKIYFVSEQNIGTTFTMTLPLSKAENLVNK